MKKLIYSTLGLILAGSLILSGCKDKTTDDPVKEAPKPTITFKNTSGYTFVDGKVINTLPTAALKFGFVVTHTLDLKSVKVTRNYNGSGEVVVLTQTVSGSSFSVDVFDTLALNLKGTYVYTFTALDKDATLGTNKITITATGKLTELTAQRVYNNKGAGFGAYDLILGDNISTADASNKAARDIVDNSTTTTIQKEWISGNTTMFIKGPFSKQYTQLTTEEDVKSLWDLNVANAKNTVTAMNGTIGMMVLAKVIRTGTPVYIVMTIDDIVDDTGADGDYTEFTFKY